MIGFTTCLLIKKYVQFSSLLWQFGLYKMVGRHAWPYWFLIQLEYKLSLHYNYVLLENGETRQKKDDFML